MKNLVFFYALLISSLLITSCKKDFEFREVNTKKNNTDSRVLNTALLYKVYYVSPAGNDNNDGTSTATPWQTLIKVNAQIFAPGDQVLFEGGKTFTGTLSINSSGTNGNNIKFASYGTGKASIISGNNNGIFIYNNSFILIDNLIVTGGWKAIEQAGNNGYGIFFYTTLPNAAKLGNVSVYNCEVSGFKNAGISFMSYPADLSQGGYSNIVVRGNSVYGNGSVGISTWSPTPAAGNTVYAFPNVVVAYNKVYDNMGIKSNTTSHSGDGIMIGDASGGLVSNNISYNNGWYNACLTEGPAAIWCYDSKNLVFQYNEAHHNGTGAGTPDGDGFDLDGGTTNCIMQYNYSHDNYAAGFLVWEYGNTRINNSNNTIRYNISQNDNINNNNTIYGGISVGPNCSYNLIYNNTIWSNKGSSVFVYGGNKNHFYNNIFFATQTNTPIINVVNSTTDCWFLNNDYYNPLGFTIKFKGTTYSTLSNFRATGNERFNSINYGYNTDPLLSRPGTGATFNSFNPSTLTNYSLNAGSPMIDKGYNLTSWNMNVGSVDFNKASIPFGGGYDIGACEKH